MERSEHKRAIIRTDDTENGPTAEGCGAWLLKAAADFGPACTVGQKPLDKNRGRTSANFTDSSTSAFSEYLEAEEIVATESRKFGNVLCRKFNHIPQIRSS